MEQIAIFEEKIMLSPLDLRADVTSFDSILIDKLSKKMEGKCSQHGFVIPKSLKLLSRSLGYAEKGRFTGDFIYYIKAQGQVLNPPEGIVLEGEVVRKNKMGLYVILNDAIRVMIPRDLHIGNDEFDSVEQSDMIEFEIKKSQFQINDSHILSVGMFRRKKGQFANIKPSVMVREPTMTEAITQVVEPPIPSVTNSASTVNSDDEDNSDAEEDDESEGQEEEE
jgi:DNA-directed RNA polymerase subunit E'/Rpb7